MQRGIVRRFAPLDILSAEELAWINKSVVEVLAEPGLSLQMRKP